MKKFTKIFVSILCVLALALPVFAMTACGDKHVDYAAELKLDLNSSSIKQQVTVRTTVDGDTTHFDPVKNPKYENCNHASDFSNDKAPTKGFAKARYLAINTPESTGKIEPYGKTASNFTKEKLKSAKDIIIESDNGEWNIDSTGTRYLLWVWYNTEENPEFRNLNLEILQAGLAYASNIPELRYADICQKALDQARAEKLYLYSGENDPDFDYSDVPYEVDLKELRFNPESYLGRKIAVEGLVVADYGSSCYIEKTYTYSATERDAFDSEQLKAYEELNGGPLQDGTAIRIGMPVLHFNNNPELKLLKTILVQGNYVRVAGVLTFYEEGGYYQITSLQEYNDFPMSEEERALNCEILKAPGMEGAFTEIDGAEFGSTEEKYGVVVSQDGEDVLVKKTYAATLEGSSVSVTGAKIVRMYTTSNGGSNDGAITLTCEVNGVQFTVRTGVFEKPGGGLYTESDYQGRTIDAKGIVGYYNGTYQINCYKVELMTIH